MTQIIFLIYHYSLPKSTLLLGSSLSGDLLVPFTASQSLSIINIVSFGSVSLSLVHF